MKRPLVSIVCPTFRVGGLDLLFASLEGQTLKSFELVLVDAIHAHRGKLPPTSFPVTHVPPRDNAFPRLNSSNAVNTGLRAAMGEILLHITDYTWLPPDCVERHILFHDSHGADSGYMGPHAYVQAPRMSQYFVPYEPGEMDRYIDDIRSGSLDSCMIGAFAEPWMPWDDPRELPTCDNRGGRDCKLDRPAGPIEPTCFHAKNESYRIEHAYAVNGWDEALDGAYGYQDVEYADRLTKLRGVEWTLDPTNVVTIVNPRMVFPHAKRERPSEENEAYWRARQAMGYPGRVNGWSIGEGRGRELDNAFQSVRAFAHSCHGGRGAGAPYYAAEHFPTR